jgi:dTDP-4-amino-4,6-dideoxygalactose transaminase
MIASGPETKLFEEEFAEFVDVRFACAVNNGTAALNLALLAVGIGPGDEVITTPMTFIATANAIMSCGAKPVFADIDEKTYNLCPKAVEKAITEKTVAILPVHLYGLPADMIALRKVADEHDLYLIGDAAQAHGSSIGHQKVGSLADIECFSFYPTKNMTTGEGGMVTTNNKELFHMLDSIRNHGRPDSTLGQYEHIRFGLNLRTTDIGSAIGRVQLRKLPMFNETRKRNAEMYLNGLSDVPKVILPYVPNGFEHVWHQFTIRTENRESLASFLKNEGIETRTYYPRLIQDYPHLEIYRSRCPMAEQIVTEVISLPVHPGLTVEDVDRIISAIQKWSAES